MSDLFWLTADQWAQLAPLLPVYGRGKRRATRRSDAGQHAHQGSPHGRRRKRGAQKQAIGCSRGGRNTRLHIIVDAHGKPRVLSLSGGNTHDSIPAKAMFALVAPTVRVLADAAYDSAALRAWLAEQKLTAVIPNRVNRKKPFAFVP